MKQDGIAMQIASKMSRIASSAWVLVTVDGKWLLGKRSREVGNSGQWGLFGGSIEPGEDPAKGAARELFEETGIRTKPDKLTHIGRKAHPSDDKKHSYYFLLSAKKAPEVKINWETEKAKWFSRKDAGRIGDKHFTLDHAMSQKKLAA